MAPRSARPLLLALAALVLVLAAPAAAMAQSAGDEQYADPFGEVPEEQDAGGGGSTGGGNTGADEPTADGNQAPAQENSGTVAPTSSGEALAQDTSTGSDTGTDTSSATAAQGDEELARTGLPAYLITRVGLMLLAAGALMRVALDPSLRSPA